jgi:hypothetical protein
MLRLVKAFWDITMWRRSPAQLPASLFLLGLVVFALGALEALLALLPPSSGDRIITRVALSVGLPLLFAWTVLAVTHHRQRFLQTGIALLGVEVLAELLLYPLSSLLNGVGSDWAAVPLMALLCLGLVWYLLACANIWRAALDSGVGVALAVSVGYLVLSTALVQQLLPST